MRQKLQGLPYVIPDTHYMIFYLRAIFPPGFQGFLYRGLSVESMRDIAERGILGP